MVLKKQKKLKLKSKKEQISLGTYLLLIDVICLILINILAIYKDDLKKHLFLGYVIFRSLMSSIIIMSLQMKIIEIISKMTGISIFDEDYEDEFDFLIDRSNIKIYLNCIMVLLEYLLILIICNSFFKPLRLMMLSYNTFKILISLTSITTLITIISLYISKRLSYINSIIPDCS